MTIENKQQSNDIKHLMRKKGLTLKSFSEQHGFTYRAVSDVVRGLSKGNFGERREIVEKLHELGVM